MPTDTEKWTKGEWKQTPRGYQREISGNHYVDEDGDAVSTTIAIVSGNATSQEATEANANMLAASNSLYRELSHLVRLLEPLNLNIPSLNGARKAMEKARGK